MCMLLQHTLKKITESNSVALKTAKKALTP